MPLYRPRSSGHKQAVGDQPGREVPQTLMETSMGAFYAWDNTEAPVERAVFRLSQGERGIAVIPQNERVIIMQTIATPSGSFETETGAIDFGTGGLLPEQPEVGNPEDVNARLEAETAQNQAIAEAERQAQAQDAAYREAQSQAAQNIVEEPPPIETEPPPAPTAGGASGATEAPITSNPGGIGPEAEPSGGCETMEQTYIDPELGEITITSHYNGSSWT